MKIKVLVLSAGGPAGKALCRCLKNEQIYLIGADCNAVNLNFIEADKKYLVPNATDEKYFKFIKDISEKEKIDYIFAQNDKEVERLAFFTDKLKASTFLPTYPVIKICQNKTTLFKVLNKDIPKFIDEHNDEYDFCWIRATEGAGGKGSLKARGPADIHVWKELNKNIKDWQIVEYLPGKNIGVDIIMQDGEVIFYSMKEREKYLPGASMSGVTGSADIIKIIDDKNILDIVVNALRTLDPKIHGVFGVDLKGDIEGKYKITEINPGRFLTSSLVSFHLTDYNMPLLLLKEFFDIEYKTLGPEIGIRIIRQVDSFPMVIK